MVNFTFIWSFSLINRVDNVNWPPSIVSKLTHRALALRQSDWRNCGLCVCLPYLLDLNAALELTPLSSVNGSREMWRDVYRSDTP